VNKKIQVLPHSAYAHKIWYFCMIFYEIFFLNFMAMYIYRNILCVHSFELFMFFINYISGLTISTSSHSLPLWGCFHSAHAGQWWTYGSGLGLGPQRKARKEIIKETNGEVSNCICFASICRGSAHWLIAGFDKNQSCLYLSSSRTRMAPQVRFQFVAEVVECFSASGCSRIEF
jgi:hypothetical protein